MIDKHALLGYLQTELPSNKSFILVGSASRHTSIQFADIDVISFDNELDLLEEKSLNFIYQDIPIHVMIYNPALFTTVISSRIGILGYLREIKKIYHGAVLKDQEGAYRNLMEIAKTHPLATTEIARPFLAAAKQVSLKSSTSAESRINFYYGLENLAFGMLNSSFEYRYSKPKWICLDIESSPFRALNALYSAVSKEIPAQAKHDYIERFKVLILKYNLNETEVNLQLKDATEGREFIFPLRMCAYFSLNALAKCLRIEYLDMRSAGSVLSRLRSLDAQSYLIMADILRLEIPLPKSFHILYDQAVHEFEELMI